MWWDLGAVVVSVRKIAPMAARVFDDSSLRKSQIPSGCIESMDIQMLDAFPSFSAGCDHVDDSGSLGSDSFFDVGKLAGSLDVSPSECPSADGSQEIAMPSIRTLSSRRRKRSKSKADAVELQRERQAAKNRKTAKAFRSKMDTMKSYSETRVQELTAWTKGLAMLIVKQKLERTSTS